jgi:altered-inheritance-of-mitochondria protein 5
MGFATGFVCLGPFFIFALLPQDPTYTGVHVLIKIMNLQFGGFTLTTSILYLSLQVHRTNRLQQRNAIREQTEIINYLASPAGAYYRRFAPEYNQSKLEEVSELTPLPSRRPSREDVLKHQWNKEVETLARKALAVRWQDVQEIAMEGFRTISRFVKKE